VIQRLRSRIARWSTRNRAGTANAAARLAPEVPFFAVGDIHGCPDLLHRIIRAKDALAMGGEPVVFCGDYIDRGAGSAKVLTRLFDAQQTQPDQVICLMGNHERMMLDFIDDPAGRGAGWLRFGGLDTLASFGVSLRQQQTDAEVAVAIANALEAALPEGMLAWLRGLPLRWSSGNVHCVHAAMSPRRTAQDQREAVLLWGHPDFLKTARDDGQFVLHGHTIVPQAQLSGSRISIDTGAYRTGCLSAVRIASGHCRFFSVSANDKGSET
jgi:predicted MPP superfamily phosphohydrolase